MSLFEQILKTNVINFLIVVWTLAYIFKKANLGKIIDKMADDVKVAVEKSENNVKEANKEYEVAKEDSKKTPQLQEEIIDTAKENAKKIEEKIIKETEKEKDGIKTNIEKILLNQAQEYKNLTVDDVFKASIELTKEEVQKRLDNSTHQRLIDKSIEEIDKLKGSLI